MHITNSKRPLVSSSSVRSDYGSDREFGGAKGAKNLWRRNGCHQTIYLATYNIRTMLKEDRLYELEQDVLSRIKWHIIGLCETRKRGEELVKLQSGHLMYHKGHQDRSIGGIGMLIHKSMASKISNITAISARVIYATFKLNTRYELKVIQ